MKGKFTIFHHFSPSAPPLLSNSLLSMDFTRFVDVEKLILLAVFLQLFHIFVDCYMKEVDGVGVMKLHIELGFL